MTEKTSEPEKLYTWAINAVCEEMEALGFRIDIENEAANETVLLFTKSKTKYGIALSKQSGNNGLTAEKAFDFFPLVEINVDDRWRALAKITLLGITADEKEVKDFVTRRVDKLFGGR